MIPRAVREQAERAEAAHLALLAGNTGQPAPEAHQMTPPVETPAPVVESTPVDPVVAPPAPVAVAAAPAAEPVADSWELRYRVLEGKYRSEVPRLAAEIRELKAQLAGGGAPASTPTAPAGEARKRVVEQYGEDFAGAVNDIATEQTEALRREVEELKGGTAERARADFFRDLHGLVPTWQQIDQEAGFTAYLDEFDSMTGRTRREFFNEADAGNNAARVASFFASYLGTKKPAPGPAAVVETPPSVDHLITPDSSNHSEAAVAKKQWTRAEAAAFYAAARSQGANAPYGRYTAAQYQQIDADINAAIVEGRFVG